MTVLVSRRHHLAVAGLLILFLLLATVYNATSPPFEAPDEIGHFYYVVHLLQSRRLPVVPASGPPPHYEHEGIQPPLYYAGAALFVRALSAPLQLDGKAFAVWVFRQLFPLVELRPGNPGPRDYFGLVFGRVLHPLEQLRLARLFVYAVTSCREVVRVQFDAYKLSHFGIVRRDGVAAGSQPLCSF